MKKKQVKNQDVLNRIERFEKTRLALLASGIGTWDYDIPNNRIYWDEQMYRLCGINQHDFADEFQAMKSAVISEDFERVSKVISDCIKNESAFSTEIRVLWPDGQIRYLDLNGNVIVDESGDSSLVVGSCTDVTKRKLAEEEIKKFSSIASQTDNIVLITNAEGKTEWVNEAFVKCTGYLPEEIYGHYPGHLLQGPDTDPATIAIISSALKEQKPVQVQILNYRKDKRPYWIELRINPIFSDSNKLKGFISLQMDISDRVATEKKLERQQDMLEAMSRHGNIGAWELDMKSQKIYWSSMTKIIHEVPEDFEPDLESGINFYKEGKSRDTINRAVSEAIEKGIPWNEELQLVTAKGKEIWVQATGQGEFKKNECVRLFGSFQDIEERKQSEKALTKAKEAAEAAAAAKSNFLASMSHEIRTPMNGVLGMLGLLTEEPLSDNQLHRAMLAKSSAESLLTIINDILDFSKVEADKLELESIDFDLHELFCDFTETMAFRAYEKELELFLDISEVDESVVRGDPNRLKQILNNLVGNALKFTNKGEILIQASLKKTDSSNLLLECTVTDSGIGIPADKLNTLFESFTQVDVSTTRQYGGTGLGLAITKKLCHLMGGEITVQSEHGRGSTFRFSIELQESKLVPMRAEIELDNLQILVAITSKTRHTLICSQLRAWGAIVDEAKTPVIALKQLSEQDQRIGEKSFHAIVIDSNLVDSLNGISASALKQYAFVNNTQVIILATTTREKTAHDYKRDGYDNFLSKPVTSAKLQQALTSFMSDEKTVAHNSLIVDAEKAPTAPKKLDAHVLVVEDNDINQIVVESQLATLHVSCELASNGIEAINILKKKDHEKSFDLILMDCQMPEMDGFQASRQIRKGDAGRKYQNIPIIALTANAMKGDKEACLAAGMTDYLSKPLRPDSLEKMLRLQLL